LTQSCTGVNNGLNHQVFDFCRHIAGSAQITAIALIDNYADAKSMPQIIAVVKDFQPRLMSYIKNFNGRTFIIFAVDQWIFERDIERGFLGEAIASKLIFPYSKLQGSDYLHEREIALKKRLILEAIENLALSYPELASHLQIRPQYFIYEVILNRVRVFPLLAYELTNLLNGTKLKNESEALTSYNEALKQLETEKKINLKNDYVTISNKFVIKSQNPRVWLMNISKKVPRTLFTSFFGVFPQLINVVSQNTEAFIKTQKISWKTQIEPTGFNIDPQKYVFVPTSEGLVALSDEVDIKGFVRRMLANGENINIKVTRVGGMLNDVYLIDAYIDGDKKKVLVKRFKDWSGFKWFPLTLWSYGARTFAVSAKARLAKECATSEFLRRRGFNVPKILHVSTAERLVFMEYVEGENLSEAIKRIASATNTNQTSSESATIEEVGKIFAHVHSNNMSLGDSKPENIIVDDEGKIYLLDFEQATLNGDKVWDIAEFLYYSGHYLQPLYSNGKAESIAKAFIRGYLSAGGNVNDVKEAGTAKYTRVFSVFTMPSLISSIANICRKTEAPR
jgi:Kae1-associated kinase Bud32